MFRSLKVRGGSNKGKALGPSYNQRLFSGGFRAYLHFARFHWVARDLAKRGIRYNRVLELGCFDGKLLEFLPKKPDLYLGYDANWEGGIDLAREKWRDRPEAEFHIAESAEDLNLAPSQTFELAVCMETLEHVPPEHVAGYLKAIAEHCEGVLLVTVPNEKGLVFLFKWLAKTIIHRKPSRHSVRDVVNATLGRTDRIERAEHKGFNYSVLIAELRDHFDVVEVVGIPFQFLPCFLNFGVGVVAVSKSRPAPVAG
jgi:2-polyprenyl-3-methyl-5-hydroxy-6-metoxy-1,4-benzoquinol methylase